MLLIVTSIYYILGILTNSNPNLLHDRSNLVLVYYNPILGGWLHDRSNLVLIYYNHILSVRNSNKLKSRIGSSDARSGKWNKRNRRKNSRELCSLSGRIDKSFICYSFFLFFISRFNYPNSNLILNFETIFICTTKHQHECKYFTLIYSLFTLLK
jgi:hypothetical protein